MVPAVRFVHCAGFRFDSPLWDGPSSWTVKRNQDLWMTFEAVLAICQTEQADFLFLTGNLFEQEYTRKETVERVAKSLARLDKTKIFIVPGEKDPLVLTSVYRFAEWPDNVHIFSGDIRHIKMPSLGVTIYGTGWVTYRQNSDFLEGFSTAEEEGQIRFMLLHAKVDDSENTDGFIPIQEEQIATSGLTYLALGHQESWSGLQQIEETSWADCGVVEARSFRESGPHGVLLGETDGNITKVKFIEVSNRRYIEKSLCLTRDIQSAVEQILADTTVQERQKDVFRLKLTESLQETTAVQALQKLLAAEFSFIEVIPYEDRFVSQIENHAAESSFDVGKETDIVSLTQIFTEEIQKRIMDSSNDLEQRHWQLVQKIGQTALSRNQNASSPDGKQISLMQAWHALASAKRKVEEQAVQMEPTKQEYEALKREWETVNRQHDEIRSLRIEMKKLQIQKANLTEKINHTIRLQQRLTRLQQNPDYRELRRTQAELSGLQERCNQAETELTTYTRDTQVDHQMIENLHEECLEWAGLLEKAEHSAEEIQQLTEMINETQNHLQVSRYSELQDNEDQFLRQAREEQDNAEEELQKLAPLFADIELLENNYNEKSRQIQDLAAFATITPADERKMIRTMQRLEKWQSSKISGFLDRALEERLGATRINERFTARLARNWQKYQVSDYAEFKKKQKEYLNQKEIVVGLQTKLGRLQKERGREKELRRIIHSRSQILKRAYNKVSATDYVGWVKGWEDYRYKKKQLVEMRDRLHLKKEQFQAETQKANAYVGGLREKLKNWESSVSNVDEVLQIVIKVARRLQAKEEAEKEYTALKQKYNDQLGERDIDELTRELEPLADLEREIYLSDEKRQKDLLACQQTLASIEHQIITVEKSLRNNRTTRVTSDLEKKLENVKRKWQTHEQLQRALTDTENILKASLNNPNFF